MDELIDLETQGWRALSTDGGAAVAFYDDVLDTEVSMLLPGGLRITDRGEALRSMSGAPWDTHQLEDPAVQHLHDDVALVTYAVAARRGEMSYSALVASLYVRRPGGWRLAFHQQTPR